MTTNNQYQNYYTNPQVGQNYALPQRDDDNYKILPVIYEQRQHQQHQVYTNVVAATPVSSASAVPTGYTAQYVTHQIQNSTAQPQYALPQTQYTAPLPCAASNPQYQIQMTQPTVQPGINPQSQGFAPVTSLPNQQISCVPISQYDASHQLHQPVCPPLCVPANQGVPIYEKAPINYSGSNCGSPCNSKCHSPCEPRCYSPCGGNNHGCGPGCKPSFTPPPIGDPKTYTFLTPLEINFPPDNYQPDYYSHDYPAPPHHSPYPPVYQLPPVHAPRRCSSMPRYAPPCRGPSPTILPTIYRPHNCKKQAEILDDFVEVLENDHYFPTWKKSRNKDNKLWDDYFDALKRTKKGPHDHLFNSNNVYDFHEKKSKHKSHNENNSHHSHKIHNKTKDSDKSSVHSKLRDTTTGSNLSEKYSYKERNTLSDLSSVKQKSPKTSTAHEIKPMNTNYSSNFKSQSYY